MNRYPWQVLLGMAALLAAAPDVHAQRAPQDPHIGYVYPAGGQQGSTFEVTVGGQNLRYFQDTLKERAEAKQKPEVDGAYISGGGITAKIVKYWRPITQGENTRLSMRLRDTEEKLEKEQAKKGKSGPIPRSVVAKAAGISEEDLKQMEIYRKRRNDPKRQPNIQIAEEVTLQVTVAPDAQLGNREVRLITPTGMSNPMWFQVSQWPECRETEPNDTKAETVARYKLPIVINGQSFPADVDRFSFTATKGTKLVITVAARELIPYLADAVPGWFQAALSLYDAKGEEVAFAGAYHHRQDPVIYYEVPEDGEYVVAMHDSIFRGREDFVYRITVGQLPFVTGVFPAGGRSGSDVTVDLQGWNLRTTKASFHATVDRGRPLRWYVVPQTDRVSVRVPLQIDSLTEIMEQESNDTLQSAQVVTPPLVINGRIDKPDDCDMFRFDGYGKIVVEVYARRISSPLDSALTLFDASGKEIGFNDDYEDKGQPLITHHADSRLAIALPGNGPYTLRLCDSQRKGGADFIYRLQIRAPRPDFELRVVPSSVIARPGTSVPIAVHALRRDDYAEDISLTLVNPPAGFKLDAPMIPGNQNSVRLTLTVPKTTTPEPISLEMEGKSTRGRPLTHVAVPAEAMVQAFAYTQLVPARDWTVMVSGKPEASACLECAHIDHIRLVLGATTQIRAMAPKGAKTNELKVELNDPPDGIVVDKVTPEGPGIAIVLSADAKKVKSGLKGNLIFKSFREWTPPAVEGKPAPKPQKTDLGFLPAIPFEVVGKGPRR